jgi:hypothetical protein
MANHTITVINKNARSSNSENNGSRSKKKKATSSSEKFAMKYLKVNKLKSSSKLALALATVSSVTSGYFSIAAASSGEEMKYNNYKATLGAVLNPVGFLSNYVKRATIDEQKINRENTSLNYQRQLTGNLVYSQKFNNGTF